VNQKNLEAKLAYNPMLVTSLNSVIGYEKAAEIAKQAYISKRPIIDVAKEMTDISYQKLKILLDPKNLTTS
jgi:fumarate hydratase class II